MILAKTHAPEYMWSYETESVPHGRTLNAFDPARTSRRLERRRGRAARLPAASSLGIGTDGGGSIRVPSHYNGIGGLRPSVRLVPETGCWPPSRETGMLDMACVGPMARSVDDLALMLRRDRGRRRHRPVRRACDGYSGDHRTVDVAGLRVGFYAEDGAWPATAETRAAVRRAANGAGRGRRAVEEVAPPPSRRPIDLFFG